MKTKYSFIVLLLLISVVSFEGKKISKGRGSSRSSSRKTSNSQPVPTSHSYSQSAPKPSYSHPAPKPSFTGWQEKPAQSQSSGSRQNKPTQTHSYPSSQTGLSGQSVKPQPSNTGNVQKSHAYPQNSGSNANQPQQTSGNQQSNVNHGYPTSNGMSGSGTGASNPSQQGGLSGNAAKQPPSYQESVQKSNSYQQNHGYPNNPHSPNNQQNHGYPANHGMSGNSGTGVGYPAHQGPGGGYGNNYNRAPPPPYPGNYGPSYGGGYGGSHNPGYGSQMPGYFGNYGNSGRGFGGMTSRSALTGVGIAGAGVGTLLTGLALWNLARSTGNRHHTVVYDNRGQPVAVAPSDNSTAVDPILGELVNCTLTISSKNATEVLAIPCAIATSFTPEADVKDTSDMKNDNDTTTCMVTVVTKASREFMTTIPCSILLNSAAENNVTEPPEIFNSTGNMTNETAGNMTMEAYPSVPAIQLHESMNNTSIKPNNCTSPEPGETRDPINPCYAVTHDVTVQPLVEDDGENLPSTTSP